jgi:hypothetical protein
MCPVIDWITPEQARGAPIAAVGRRCEPTSGKGCEMPLVFDDLRYL